MRSSFLPRLYFLHSRAITGFYVCKGAFKLGHNCGCLMSYSKPLCVCTECHLPDPVGCSLCGPLPFPSYLGLKSVFLTFSETPSPKLLTFQPDWIPLTYLWAGWHLCAVWRGQSEMQRYLALSFSTFPYLFEPGFLRLELSQQPTSPRNSVSTSC